MCLDICKPQNSANSKENSIPMDMEQDNVLVEETDVSEDDLRLHQVAGGSIVRLPPLFSPDGESIIIAWRNVVRVFNIFTGEWIRDLEKAEGELISLEFDSNSGKLLIGCCANGQVNVWKWRSGVCDRVAKIQIKNSTKILSFNIVPNKDEEDPTDAVVVAHNDLERMYFVALCNFRSGNVLEDYSEHCTELGSHAIKVAVSRLGFFTLVHSNHMFVLALDPNGSRSRHRIHPNDKFTTVKWHPVDALIATGDTNGKVILWRNLFGKRALSTIYHWHATAIKTITFTDTGSNFYSGGGEFVLVKWTLDRPDVKQYLPRMRGAPTHVAVGPKNMRVAVSLTDNEIQLLNANLELSALVQNFTYVHEDGTGLDPFPCGLHINPRNQSVVLNGRVGHLQFFSPYSKTLLYNMDITGENILAEECNKVLYNTRVTKIALSEDWLVTVECWDDQQQSIHVQMKFWRFCEEEQNYSLNTSMLMAHYSDVTALELSTKYRAEVLHCASAGKDNILKLWSNNRSIYGKGNVWQCVGQRGYKNLPIKTLRYSADGSILAAGFGRNIVIFKGDNLRDIRCVLTAPSGLDGMVNHVSIMVEAPKTKSMAPKKAVSQKKDPVIELVGQYIGAQDEAKRELALKELILSVTEQESAEVKPLEEVSMDKKQEVFGLIMEHADLNLMQKLSTLKSLDIATSIYKEAGPEGEHLANYLKKMEIAESDRKDLLSNCHQIIALRDRYKEMATVKELVKSETMSKDSRLLKKMSEHWNGINKIEMGTGESSHLLIASTMSRVLIWNLLTLKLHSVLKLSCRDLAIDPISGLVAAFTENNQLYIFPPNSPMPVYRRKNLPEIYGCVWVPRRVPKGNYADWQASSQLLFLNKRQELMCLVSDSDDDLFARSATYLNDQAHFAIQHTPFAQMMGKHQTKPEQGTVNGHSANGILKKSSTLEMTSHLPHAMAPLSLLSKGYLSSFLDRCDDKANQLAKKSTSSMGADDNENDNTVDGAMDVDSDSDIEMIVMDEEEQQQPMASNNSEVNTNGVLSLAGSGVIERKLRKIAKFPLKLEL